MGFHHRCTYIFDDGISNHILVGFRTTCDVRNSEIYNLA